MSVLCNDCHNGISPDAYVTARLASHQTRVALGTQGQQTVREIRGFVSTACPE
jgi:hypothetical protein